MQVWNLFVKLVTSSPEMPFKKYRKCSSADSRQQRPALNGRPGVSGLKINHAKWTFILPTALLSCGCRSGCVCGARKRSHPSNLPTTHTHTHRCTEPWTERPWVSDGSVSCWSLMKMCVLYSVFTLCVCRGSGYHSFSCLFFLLLHLYVLT